MSQSGSLSIVAIVYILRVALSTWEGNPRRLAVFMSFVALVATPGIWFFSDSPKNQAYISFMGKWVFAPVCWLGVFLLSCWIDAIRGQIMTGKVLVIRFVLEVLLGIPVWIFVWGWLSAAANWISI